MAQHSLPWYKDRTQPPPFSITKKFQSNRSSPAPFRTLAFFPWSEDSLQTLWNGSLHTPEKAKEWNDMIADFSDAVAVGGRRKMYIFFTRQPRPPICVKLPEDQSDFKPLPTDCVHVAWTLNPDAHDEPLVIFSYSNLVYIYNVARKGIASYLRGHGGAITSIAVHPITVNLFCTTSRDYSTRIYDLRLKPQQLQSNYNPPWPPGTEASRAGAAHGLHMTESEGSGIGRCIIVLMGGRSGGHQAAVLGAAFHSHLPIIATCGLDRVVKIWFVPPASHEMLTREDKPLFSSSRVHKARVLSITWLHHDLLLTHSAPALMKERVDDIDSKETYLEPGQLVVWRWLGMDRFFPPDKTDVRQSVLRGCASDYQESASFKIISALSFPSVPTQYITPMLHVYQSSSHDPVVLFTYPKSTSITMFNVIHLQPRKPPPFPLDEASLVENTERMHLIDVAGKDPRVEDLPPEVSGWELRTTSNPESDDSERLMDCAMGMNGDMIMGVGAKGTVWIWTRRQVNK
ncbi:Polycomb group protein FIE1 [Hypsizygus marmoreus]|uniref:Polycomb group protein FIE1 n=1 Tax=Hypsizygus marmoreus TaxID=39966 RepID=A0A369K9W5_HYPMA|nr:Polycomb group protein FIE1 [Hypsizygus marmoreus]